MGNGATSHVTDMLMRGCLHNIRFAGSIVSLYFQQLWLYQGTGTGANGSCVEATPGNGEVLSELTFFNVACDISINTSASGIGWNFHATGSGVITGTRIFDTSIYHPRNVGMLIQGDGTSLVADFWCYSCQADGLEGGDAFSLVTTGSATMSNIVLDKPYVTNVSSFADAINVDGSGGGTLKNIGIYGAYVATGGGIEAIRVETATDVNIIGARLGAAFSSRAILINDCQSCIANNNSFDRNGSGTIPFYVLLGGSTDYSQACNNSGGGATSGPATTSASTASGTHNIFFGGSQSCPNN
jgi:hypothetical protein